MPIDPEFAERKKKQYAGERDDALARAEHHAQERQQALKYAERKQGQIDELDAELKKVDASVS